MVNSDNDIAPESEMINLDGDIGPNDHDVQPKPIIENQFQIYLRG